jgi:hypothetical protein
MSDAEIEETKAEEPFVEPQDPVLASLIDLVNVLGKAEGAHAEIPVTLLVGGSLVSGALTSARRWWEEKAAELEGVATASEGDHTLGEFIGEQFQQVSKVYEGRAAGAPIAYLHLKQVRIAGLAKIDNLYLRIRVPDVQGWSFGSVE